MSTAAPPLDRWRTARRLVLVVDLVLLLFPPIHWLVGDGPESLWYFLAANAVVTASLSVLWLLRDRADDEDGAA